MRRKIPLVYKAVEWESNGYWHVNDTSNVSGISSKWWVPARILGLTPADFIVWLIKNYEPDKISWNGETFLYSWSNYSKAHAYLLYINKLAKSKNFKV